MLDPSEWGSARRVIRCMLYSIGLARKVYFMSDSSYFIDVFRVTMPAFPGRAYKSLFCLFFVPFQEVKS
jgi:hypothetical protein